MNTLFPETRSSAVLSSCKSYRYVLEREWSSAPRVHFVMLNPSTADADQDDATIWKCMRFARRWGAGGILVYNLFALRATDPKALRVHEDPVGPGNDAALAVLAESVRASAGRLIAGWGTMGAFRERDRAVMKILQGARVEALALNTDGSPKHPLYVKGAAVPFVYTLPGPSS